MGKELVKFKGTVDGIKIYLDADGDFFEIFTSLHEKLREYRKFFGDGHCNVYFVGRELTASDKMRLGSIVSAMLPESSVVYGDRKVIKSDDDLEKTLDLSDMKNGEIPEETKQDELFKDIKEVSTANFKSSRARYYEGVVRKGKTVEADGHLVLMGDVEEGAKVIAVGNIIIMGSLCGSAEAGTMGNDKAYVLALNFEPTDVRISKIYRNFKEDERDFEQKSKKAYLINNQICVEDFLVEI
ncbi:MAG: septum site-determining protein MinC [Clostridia bacterium]|nr:septum site-determining protein MinC [Clostridia bacterium]